VGLGLAAAVAFQMMRSPDASAAGGWLARQMDRARASAEARTPARPPTINIDRIQRWRREADELTLASVALDEAAYERWLPRLERLEGALVDPATPEATRLELAWIEAKLLETGVIGPPDG